MTLRLTYSRKMVVPLPELTLSDCLGLQQHKVLPPRPFGR